jgi:asparagine synthase (glutamine-hydrolysing)
MPELCGICSADELSPDQKVGWARMRDTLLLSGKGQIENEERRWAAVAVVAHHAHDSATIIHQKGSKSSCALIGIDPAIHAVSDSFNDFTTLDLNDDRFFANSQPPFVACQLDAQSRAARVIGDHYGLLPLYYACHAGVLVFCTKIGPLLKSGLVRWKLDPKAVLDFFTYEHVTGDHTLADTVHLLPPATILIFLNGSVNTQSYCHEMVTNTDSTKIPIDKAANMLCEQLSNSVASAMSNRSRVAITLSGGLDSRALLGCAIKHRPDLQAYTFGPPDSSDTRYARKLAHVCGVKHTSINADSNYLYRWFDHGLFVTSGMVSCIHYHILQLADVLAAEADVVLDGLGGDALTGGHLTRRMINADSTEIAVNAIYRQHATGWTTIEARRNFFEPDFLRTSNYNPKNAIRKYFEKLGDRPLWYGCYLFDLSERQRRFIQFGPHQLRTLLDIRTPFYSVNLVEFLKNLEAMHLMGQRTYRFMHIKHLPALAKVPDSARGMPLSWPDSIRFAKHIYDFACRRLPTSAQHIFSDFRKTTDYATWFRTGLRSFVEDRLLDSNRIFEGIIKKDMVELIVCEHMSGKMDHTVKIGCLLTFISWYRSMKEVVKNYK